MGRTGEWWAFENYGVRPDIMSIAKGLQVGAVAYDKNGFEPEGSGVLSSTWGGGSRIDMMVGARVIEVITRDKLLQNAVKIGNILKNGLKELLDKKRKINHIGGDLGNDKENKSSTLTDVRGVGLMIGIEFGSKETRNEKLLAMFKKVFWFFPRDTNQ